MTTLLALLFTTAVVAGLAAALDRNHRRTAHLPRAPFGADVEADADLARVTHDLGYAATLRGDPPDQSSGSSSRASHVARRSTAVSNSGWVSVNS